MYIYTKKPNLLKIILNNYNGRQNLSSTNLSKKDNKILERYPTRLLGIIKIYRSLLPSNPRLSLFTRRKTLIL